jgi:hypothetical protein
MPPNAPIGASVPFLVSIRFWWNSFGGSPSTFTISGAKIAIRMSRATTTAPAIATLSRFSLVQEIRQSERPSIRAVPARMASGSAAVSPPGSTSSGVVTR